MSQRGKRGKTKGKKTYPPESFYIDFSEDGLAIRPTRYRFATWFSLELKSRISYNLEWDKVPEAMKDQLWLSAKGTWNIPNDNAKSTQLRIANDLFRKFKNNLVTNYELTEAHCLRLKQLERKEREIIVDGTIHIAGQDPLTRVLGPDHPGRTRAKSSVVRKKKGLGNAGVGKRKVVIDDYDAFVNKVTLNVLAAIPTLQQDSGISQQPQSICASGGPLDEISEIEVSKKISSHKSMSHLSSNGPSRYQTACARVRHTPIDEPVPSQAPLTGHGHQLMIHVASPDRVYGKTFYESVEYKSLLGWITNDWIDCTILHWWCMHLFEMVSKEEFNTCAFFNPMIIQGRVCDQESNFAIKHILATVEAHKEKEIFLAPYLTFDNSFKWTMLQCNQQVALWECGYYVMKFVFKTLYMKQKPFSHQLHDSTRALRKDELDGWINNAGSKLFQDYYNDD
nr:ulp1 protease family, C-terminal catalytic domain-containing protein [Tanacetum cinerariifolium]